jgi:hypothetical protein
VSIYLLGILKMTEGMDLARLPIPLEPRLLAHIVRLANNLVLTLNHAARVLLCRHVTESQIAR